jgi:hypothetical protein
MFSTERQNIIKACDIARNSPLIGRKIPVHGLLADIETGKLDWIVNGYDTLSVGQSPSAAVSASPLSPPLGASGTLGNFDLGEMKFPETKIGDWVSAKAGEIQLKVQDAMQNAEPAMESAEASAKLIGDYAQKQLQMTSQAIPPKIPMPPPIRPSRINVKR